MKSFYKKTIRVELILNESEFSKNGGITGTNDPNTRAISLTGIATNASIHRSAGQATAEIYLHGLSRELMGRFTVLSAFGRPDIFSVNRIRLFVKEGDDEQQVFFGGITYAAADFNQQPNVPFIIVATEIFDLRANMIKPHAFPQGTSADYAFDTICKEIGLKFYNPFNHPFPPLSPTSLTGTAYDQLDKLSQQCDCVFYVLMGRFFIVPKGSTVNADNLLSYNTNASISRINGMIGYPKVTNNGFTVSTLFRYDINPPNVVKLSVPEMGIEVDCVVQSLEHNLVAEMSGGWTTSFVLIRTTKGV